MLSTIITGLILTELGTFSVSLGVAIKTRINEVVEITDKGYMFDWKKVNQNNGQLETVDFEIKDALIPGYNLLKAVRLYSDYKVHPITERFGGVLRKMTKEEKKEYQKLTTIWEKYDYAAAYRPNPNEVQKTTKEAETKKEVVEKEEITVPVITNNYVYTEENVIEEDTNLEEDKGFSLSLNRK